MCGGYLIYLKINLDKGSVVISEDNSIVKVEPVKEEVSFRVDIKGAVKKPGVYVVSDGSIINDVIKLAGGLNKNADTSLNNLAKKVTDEMVIIIYTKEEVKNSNITKTVVKEIEKECICPNIQNDGCINDKIDATITNQKLININTASLDLLTSIPGIGESKAKAIIEYRENNKFNTIEDIQNVSGFGSKLYEQIKIYITT